MPAPLIAAVTFEIDFTDTSTFVDVTADVFDYWISTGSEFISGGGDLWLRGARGRVNLFNKDHKYDRRRTTSPYTTTQLSKSHRFRMRIDGVSVVYAWCEPPTHIDQSNDEIAEFRVFSSNEPIYDRPYERLLGSTTTARSFVETVLSEFGLTLWSGSIIANVSLDQVEITSTVGRVLTDLSKFIGGYVIERPDGQIAIISAETLNNVSAALLDTRFMNILVDGYVDIQDIDQVKNTAIVAYDGGDATTESYVRSGEILVGTFNVRGPNLGNTLNTSTVTAALPSTYRNARNWRCEVEPSYHQSDTSTYVSGQHNFNETLYRHFEHLVGSTDIVGPQFTATNGELMSTGSFSATIPTAYTNARYWRCEVAESFRRSDTETYLNYQGAQKRRVPSSATNRSSCSISSSNTTTGTMGYSFAQYPRSYNEFTSNERIPFWYSYSPQQFAIRIYATVSEPYQVAAQQDFYNRRLNAGATNRSTCSLTSTSTTSASASASVAAVDEGYDERTDGESGNFPKNFWLRVWATVDWDDTRPALTAYQEARITKSASVAKYGQRELKLPAWFTRSVVQSPAGTFIDKALTRLSEPISYREVEFPLAQTHQTQNDRLRDLRAADIAHLIVEGPDGHQLANHRMLVLGIEYLGGSRRLGKMRCSMVDMAGTYVQGRFILDQSRLNGPDRLG